MTQEKKIDLKDSDVVLISRQELIDGSRCPSNIFVRLSSNRYVLLVREGELADFEKLKLSQNEAVQDFYVCRADLNKVAGQNVLIAGLVISKQELSSQKKAQFISRAADSVFREIEHLGFSRESMEHVKNVSENIKTLVESKNDLFSIMQMLSDIPGELLRHLISVSGVSIIIAKALGWIIPATLEKLALGGMLHDVGLKELPRNILESPRHELSYEDQVLYENHPFRGAEILRTMPSASDDLISIVYEHHENAIGQGFPRRLRDNRMNPLAKVVALADVFSELTIKNRNNQNPKTAVEAITFIEVTLGQPFNKQAFNALKNLLKSTTNSKKAS